MRKYDLVVGTILVLALTFVVPGIWPTAVAGTTGKSNQVFKPTTLTPSAVVTDSKGFLVIENSIGEVILVCQKADKDGRFTDCKLMGGHTLDDIANQLADDLQKCWDYNYQQEKKSEKKGGVDAK